MSRPSSEFQLRFLSYIQRLLDEGKFTSTYKFALLMALADLSVELGDDSNAPLKLSTVQIAGRFLKYYWRQARPYVPMGRSRDPQILKQNTGSQAKIISLVEGSYTSSSFEELSDNQQTTLIKDVSSVVRQMPLWKLQAMAGGIEPFLYENVGQGKEITLYPGIPFCLRKFHGLVHNLAQNAWIHFVRDLKGNNLVLGESTDLTAFLFGADREALETYRPILREVQSGRCFYCRGSLSRSEVDHFIPWSRYPVDLGHNFVLSCGTCNNAKRNLLAGFGHLKNWIQRNDTHGRTLADSFDKNALVHNLEGSVQVARWAYHQASVAEANLWVKGKEVVPFDSGCQRLFG